MIRAGPLQVARGFCDRLFAYPRDGTARTKKMTLSTCRAAVGGVCGEGEEGGSGGPASVDRVILILLLYPLMDRGQPLCSRNLTKKGV